MFEVVCDDTSTITRHEWLELRKSGLGGSDAAAACGLSPYRSPVALWIEKTSPVADEEQSELFEWGHRMEEPIARAVADSEGVEVIEAPQMVRSVEHPFMLANLDRLVRVGDDEGLLECKNVDITKQREWADGPPLHYRLQVQHYLCARDLQWGLIAALLGGRKLVVYRIERDNALLESLIAKEEAFWTMVTLGRMPDIDGSASTLAALKSLYPESAKRPVEVGGSFVELLDARNKLKTEIAIMESSLNQCESEIISVMQDADEATRDGKVLATYKSQTRKEHTVKESSFRVLRVKENSD